MRKLSRSFVFILLIACTWCSYAAAAAAAAEKFILDNQHSYVAWRIQHLGFSTQTGKWYASGTLLLDQEHPENSKVEARVNVADVITGIPELDKHLKDKLFFDVKNYPTATFVSNKIEVLSKNSAKVEGVLKLRGISKPVTLNVTFNKAGKNPINDRITVGFSATAKIKRSDFGMRAFLPNLGDEVDIDIQAEAYKADDTNNQSMQNHETPKQQ
ncbi:YceI family protein [Legionella jordanis]|uniref:YceI family protein n=1 Tax=Legionella jordanis TaxID=456 RepID=UPI002A24E238|nr:YceI family protein [Legionella jordanis]